MSPYTNETMVRETGKIHIWPEEHEEGGRPLCGAQNCVINDRVSVRLKDVADEFTGGGPRNLATFVLGSTDTQVCRECAERLADETDLHTAPVQWLKGVGSTRAGKLKRNGVKTLADVWEYVDETDEHEHESELPVLYSQRLADDTGIPEGVASRLLNGLVAEEWRRETDKSGVRP